MNFPVYDSYRQSGVEWLGAIPFNWQTMRLGRLLVRAFNGTTTTQVEPCETTVPVTRIETISGGRLNLNKVGHIPQSEARPNMRLRAGDILFSHINSLSMIGNCAIFRGGEPLYAGMNLLTLRPSTDVHAGWLHWVLQASSMRQIIAAMAKPAINQASIPQSSLLSVMTPVPHPAEQAAIAAFLDRETGKIDALLEAQKRLIELLKEKRQAVISHAVTKGLDPAAPMKEAGVEWLGQVPAHWEVKPLRSFAKLVTGLTPPSEDTSLYADDAEGHPWLRPEDLDEQGLPSTASRTLTDEGIALCRSVQARSSLVCCIGTIGKVGFVKEPVATNQQITAIQPSARHRFIYHALIAARAEMEASAVGNVLRILNSARLGNIHLPLPPLGEADAISAHIDCLTAVTDELCDHAEAAIVLLKERRAALISAAVTGKIDVRGLAPEQAEAA